VCGSHRAGVIARRWFDVFAALLFLRPWRCPVCRRRSCRFW
jgi:hypothetical protein